MHWGSVDTRGERRSFGEVINFPREDVLTKDETKADKIAMMPTVARYGKRRCFLELVFSRRLR